MTTNTTPSDPGAATLALASSLDQYRRDAIDALTRAATDDPDAGPDRRVDFAGLLAGVLASVAANLGSTERLLAGRPRSWEADLVHRLIAGTVGPADEYLVEHRTVEVVVPLNVPDLAWQRPGFPDVDQALDEISRRYAAIPDDEHDPDAEWAAEDAVLAAYADAYREYAAAFTTAVAEAASRVPGLGVPVRVEAVHDPRPIYQPTTAATPATACGDPAGQLDGGWDGGEYGRVRNPDEFDDPAAADPLVLALWEAAYRAVPALTITPPSSSPAAAVSSDASARSVEPAVGEGR